MLTILSSRFNLFALYLLNKVVSDPQLHRSAFVFNKRGPFIGINCKMWLFTICVCIYLCFRFIYWTICFVGMFVSCMMVVLTIALTIKGMMQQWCLYCICRLYNEPWTFVICKFERQIKHNLFSFTNLKSSTGKRIKLGHLDILWFWLQSQHNMFIYQLYKKFGILYVYYGKIVQIQFF